MKNPWLTIPLADYEGHMRLPSVGQAELLSSLLATAVATHEPRSVAVLGCAGGNGFERVPKGVQRLVGVDVNAAYVAAARERLGSRPGLELHVCDLGHEPWPFAGMDLLFAGLLFEHVDARAVLERARPALAPGGVLVAVLQLPNDAGEITASPYRSLGALAATMRLVAPADLEAAAAAAGFRRVSTCTARAGGGKDFAVLEFRAAAGAR